jgi:microcystin-dependent protein
MSDPFIAEIVMFGGNFAPRGWALCDGQLLQISQHSALFSLLGTTYGGDGRTTFQLPDLRGRFPMHPGNGPGLSTRRLGEKSGTETETLTVGQMPSHTHTGTGTVKVSGDAANTNNPTGNALSLAEAYSNQPFPESPAVPLKLRADSVEVTNANAGGGQSHNNMPPFQCVHFIIALQGIFPSRN